MKHLLLIFIPAFVFISSCDFKTSDSQSFTIAFGSCNKEDQPQPMWKEILNHNPDLWVWLGDNIYGDSQDPQVLQKKYQTQLEKDNRSRITAIKSPLKIGFTTYLSFIAIGLIPLTVYVWDLIVGFPGHLFFWTSILTSLAFILIGFLKTYLTRTSKLKGISETLILGMIAATVAYYVGDILEALISA